MSNLNLCKTVLRRGPKPELTFEDADAQRARHRAAALADLHGARVTECDGYFLVDASAYYTPSARMLAAGWSA